MFHLGWRMSALHQTLDSGLISFILLSDFAAARQSNVWTLIDFLLMDTNRLRALFPKGLSQIILVILYLF